MSRNKGKTPDWPPAPKKRREQVLRDLADEGEEDFSDLAIEEVPLQPRPPKRRPPVRVNRLIAESGLYSRRQADQMIEGGRVKADGRAVTLGDAVPPDARITIDERPLPPPAETGVVVLHKPVGYLCTRTDPQGRPVIADLLPRRFKGWPTVGRLDFNSEGLLLLTRDGDLAQRLMLPAHHVPRAYRVKVFGTPTQEQLDKLKAGIDLDDGPARCMQATIDAQTGANCWLTVTVDEGRNRMVRRMFDTLGLPVARLMRVAFGPVTMGYLKPGKFRKLEPDEEKALRVEVGMAGGQAAPLAVRRESKGRRLDRTLAPRPRQERGPHREGEGQARGEREPQREPSGERWGQGRPPKSPAAQGRQEGRPQRTPASDRRPQERGGQLPQGGAGRQERSPSRGEEGGSTRGGRSQGHRPEGRKPEGRQERVERSGRSTANDPSPRTQRREQAQKDGRGKPVNPRPRRGRS
ncbi:MAG: rRNA pseudouridine synthase [Alphaproteobacteria bacterium CG_4_10_14_0_2_um_filter_63_37]|nr:MAG: hypothetical protein AUJ55_01265 [Proteobacteria bacterium CG1_02_64_396]PJA25999.1 MAG: rRNA pseudouridine synthase [Alphaproteobacteria bacterium CG_4_10_14_0_2_um_filter_63_37]